MKYFGQPEMSVIDYDRLKTVFVFDEIGEFETDDPKIIEFMKKKKSFIRCEIQQAEEVKRGRKKKTDGD